MHIIDLRGVTCTTNFDRAKLSLEDLENGDAVQILLDDGEPVKNVPRSLKSEGHKLIGLKQAEEGHYVLELEKNES